MKRLSGNILSVLVFFGGYGLHASSDMLGVTQRKEGVFIDRVLVYSALDIHSNNCGVSIDGAKIKIMKDSTFRLNKSPSNFVWIEVLDAGQGIPDPCLAHSAGYLDVKYTNFEVTADGKVRQSGGEQSGEKQTAEGEAVVTADAPKITLNNQKDRVLVQKIQEEIISLGLMSGPADGILGEHSKKVLTSYLEKKGEKFSGNVSQEILTELERANQQIFASVMQANSLDAYKHFLDQYPHSKYVPDAKMKMFEKSLAGKTPSELYLLAGSHERKKEKETAKRIYQFMIDHHANSELAIKANDRLLVLYGL